MKNKGTLFLIPTPLGEGADFVIPLYVKEEIYKLRIFIVEEERTARRFLRSIGFSTSFDEVKLFHLDKNDTNIRVENFLHDAINGENIGLLSEAGLPAVADPGSDVVKKAHASGIKVVPLVGASSIMLALMASGLNGQNFSFVGYLPIRSEERKKRIQQLEMISARELQTQIFIETPYRNNQLLEEILKTCNQNTLICAASNLTMPDEFIKTKTVFEWRKNIPELHKRPTVFLLLKEK